MIPTLAFGRTGHESSRTLFGAASLGRVTQEEADRTLELVDRSGADLSGLRASARVSLSLG